MDTAVPSERSGSATAAPADRTSAPALTPPDQQPIIAKLWIAHGAAWLALIAYCWTMWVVSGDFTPNTLGRGQEPLWYVVACRFVEVFFGIIVSAWIIWKFILGPRIRTGRMSFDGLFFLGAWLMFFQEPWIDWTTYQFQYATTFVNTGSWLRWIPGWSSPNAQLIPVPWVYGMAYLWMCGMLSWLSSRYMTHQRRRDPARGAVRLFFQTYALMIGVDVVMELVMTRLGLISYSATIPELTIFAGTDHQFPLYEPFSWAGTFVAFGSLHFFRDDKGRTFVERGVDKLRFPNEGSKTFARFLMLLGGAQLAILVTFNIPYWFYALHAGPMPQAFVEREWRNGGVCGPRTAYDCPDPRLPIARMSSPTNRIQFQPPAQPTPQPPAQPTPTGAPR